MPAVYFRCAVACAVVLVTAGTTWAEARIEMELATEPGFPLTGAHRWQKLLVDLGVDGVRIRGIQPGDEPMTTQRGTEASPSYQVKGILTAGDDLLIQGGRFSSRDPGRLKRFLDDLRSEGIAGATEAKGAFGVTEKQMVAAVEELTPPIDFRTQGESLEDLTANARRRLNWPLEVEADAARRLAAAEVCPDDLQTLSLGTGLAIALRPQGLVLEAEKVRGGAMQFVIRVAAAQRDIWPTGWPPQAKDQELVPVLMEFLNVEIAGIPLPKALDALQPRLKIPFLLDHAALAREQITPAEVNVSVKPGRTYYKRILEQILFQARLKGELRVDEAGSPFLWITTIKS